MSDPETVEFRVFVTPGMRLILRIASGLVLIAGFQLFILTEHTDLYFAWTIKPPITAAFLGASYWASFLLVAQASREKYWANARAGVFSAMTFTTLTTVATLLHLDRFHFHATETITWVATWAWMWVYCLVPPILMFLFIRQIREPGMDPPREFPPPLWLKIGLSLQGLIMGVTGGTLFLLPSVGISFWPWMLTPLTAQAVGAWLLGMAVAAVAVLRENDMMRARGGMFCYAALGLLHLIAIFRFSVAEISETGAPVLHWDASGIWIYALFWISVLLLGIFSIRRYRATTR